MVVLPPLLVRLTADTLFLGAAAIQFLSQDAHMDGHFSLHTSNSSSSMYIVGIYAVWGFGPPPPDPLLCSPHSSPSPSTAFL